MTDLRISDLQGNGTGAPFPPLANMTKLVTLILRSCNIIGRIPDFVGELTSLKTLNVLSSPYGFFAETSALTNLTEKIPDSFLGVKKAAYM
ncbi:hypothetical protein OIU85_002386 [Salix viminalis]|uniref:Uncharacterized protein n=1 Tax=Salix viminalis TaxID=40686 RepID=A0A9Q0ZYT9_SALVM|nr:hypothetical protein OIU85_002386 [Salix viminalis]